MLPLKDVLADITASKSLCYVYLLMHPDGYPFYVGIGTRYRISHHERDSRKNGRSPKLFAIRSIHASGRAVMYSIAGWFDSWAEGAREEIRLIESFGRAHLGLGKLTNLTDGRWRGRFWLGYARSGAPKVPYWSPRENAIGRVALTDRRSASRQGYVRRLP